LLLALKARKGGRPAKETKAGTGLRLPTRKEAAEAAYLSPRQAKKTIRAALTKDHDGSPATVLGAALDMLAGPGVEGKAAG